MNKRLIFAGVVVLLLAFLAVFAFAQTSPNVRWEYTYLSASSTIDGMVLHFNELGREGWELVEIDSQNRSIGGWFKRRLP